MTAAQSKRLIERANVVQAQQDKAKKSNSHFASSSAGTTFDCRVCGRHTRDTGHDEASLRLCAFCSQESSLENSVSDGVITEEQFAVAMAALRKRYGRSE